MLVADLQGIQTVQIGGWDAPVGITLVADRLSASMLTVSSMVLFCVMWYAISQGVRDGGKSEPVAVFLPTYMLLTMGVNMSFLAGDLFNLYVGFEVFLVASYVLLTLGASPSRVRASVSYVMVSMVSSMVFLFGLAMVYAAMGTVNLAQIGMRMEDVPTGTRRHLRRAARRASASRPPSSPSTPGCPTPYYRPSLVTAVFAGLLTKVGVYSIIRMRSTVFTDGSLDGLLMWVALATMIVGILGAMAQNDIKLTPVVHPGQPHRLHDLRHRPRLRPGPVRRHLLRRAPHSFSCRPPCSSSSVSSNARPAPPSAATPRLPWPTPPSSSPCPTSSRRSTSAASPLSGFLGKIILLEAGANEGSCEAWVLIGGAVITHPAHPLRHGPRLVQGLLARPQGRPRGQHRHGPPRPAGRRHRRGGVRRA
ncbi:proton-conducting transporter membrane subunit [Corynebacterium suedekumii]|nr:proton-conducting transporter membrane subunit [Corynebacterium suedekumii]